MGLKKINEGLARVDAIVGGWANAPQVSDIERELVLDKLKSIYEEVMFFQREEASDGVGEQTGSAGSVAWEPTEQPVAGAQQADAEVAGGAQSVAEAQPAAEPQPAKELERPVETVHPAADAGTAHTNGAGGGLFGADQGAQMPPARSVYDRRVILSLYGEDAAPAKPEAENHPAREPFAEAESPVRAAGRGPMTDYPQRTVLGEVMNPGDERLGDAFSRQAHPDDVASRVASAQTQSLRKAIGINDKFLITKELFGGDAVAYERALDDLDRFEDLDELMIHIHDNYAWNPNGAGAHALIEILTRKLS